MKTFVYYVPYTVVLTNGGTLVTVANKDKLCIVHKPSGIKAEIPLNTRRSQHQVKSIALSLLFSRLWAAQQLKVNPEDIVEETYVPDNQDCGHRK